MRLRHDNLLTGLRTLHPGSFAFVMASGIVSSAEEIFGPRWLSVLLLAIALAGYVVLCLLFVLRGALFPVEMWADGGRPERAFGFFTFVAGSSVLAVRLHSAGQTWALVVLSLIAGGAWLVLTYAIPLRIALAGSKPPAATAVDGTWLIWVVATQSLSIVLALLGSRALVNPQAAALVAVSLWAFGALLYLVLIGIIVARLLLVHVDAAQATPAYWISMGATAITVLAGGYLLQLPAGLPSLGAARGTVDGLTLLLWAFGTWWFPFLTLLTAWRYAALRERVYEQTLWSMVFPLGMYAVATYTYGRAAGLPLLPVVAGVEVWLALAAWIAVAAWMVISWIRPAATRWNSAA